MHNPKCFKCTPKIEGWNTVVSLCLYQGWGQVIIWLFVATSRFNGAHLLNFGFEKILELKDSIFKLILKPQHPNQLNYKEQIFSTMASRRKNCLLLHLKKAKSNISPISRSKDKQKKQNPPLTRLELTITKSEAVCSAN